MREESSLSSYKLAAVAYFLYGCTYLAGAVAEINSAKVMNYNGIPWWGFYLMGIAFVVVFPILVWREYRWFTRVLSLIVLFRGAALLKTEWFALYSNSPGSDSKIAFSVIAFVTGALLFWAGWISHSKAVNE